MAKFGEMSTSQIHLAYPAVPAGCQIVLNYVGEPDWLTIRQVTRELRKIADAQLVHDFIGPRGHNQEDE